jgi:multiple antibiotic resistance protein
MLSILSIVLKVTATIFVALFPVVNPIGTALILSGMTSGTDATVWKAMLRKIAANSFLVLTFFYLFGSLILQLFGITIPVVQVSGGIVLAVMGWQMLNGSSGDSGSADGGPHDTGTSIAVKAFYPYTFPITVGPGGLAVAMTFGAHVQRGTSMGLAERVGGVIGTFAICATVYLCFANLQYINKKIPPAAVKAISKMLAFFVICIGVQILWEGIRALRG